MQIAVCTTIAQAESKSLSEAIKGGFKQGFKTGDSKLYMRKCFGYSHNEYGELIVNDAEAIVVRRIFNLYLKGYSVDRIMEDLAAHHTNSSTGKKKWSKGSIQHMLTNKKYIGSVILGKTCTGEFPDNKQRINDGKKYIMRGAHSPIIANEVFEKVQEEIVCRSNIEIVNGKVQRKTTHYSGKDISK